MNSIHSRRTRIHTASRRVGHLCLGLLVYSLFQLAMRSASVYSFWTMPQPTGQTPYPEWYRWVRVANLFYPAWMVFWFGFFYRLFRAVEQGREFTELSVRYLKILSGACLLKFIADVGLRGPFVFEPVPADWLKILGRVFYWYSLPNYLLVAAAALGVAWVLDAGRLLREDQELTV